MLMFPGSVMLKFYELWEEIAVFLESKNNDYLRDPYLDWLSDLAFVVDLTSYLSKVNLQLQGWNQLLNIL